MNFDSFAFWLLCGLLSIVSVAMGWFLTTLISEIKGVREEMGNLNEKLAAVVTNQDWHQRELLRLENRVNDMESKYRG